MRLSDHLLSQGAGGEAQTQERRVRTNFGAGYGNCSANQREITGHPARRSAGILPSWVRAPPPAPWTDGGPKSLRSPCCGLAIHNNQTKWNHPDTMIPEVTTNDVYGSLTRKRKRLKG
ncbi:hypothetical protein PoB_007550100 [Plakobranchus ocellatus]|uniref:Uncharacterized protein n=1 Tax=Plakobranchus ocellatus TaxID=259542 RepID=A0AAV4DY26_9GAST|nr:hypothetical protein PoB_007550100 [Plakobranchus ocellatus]